MVDQDLMLKFLSRCFPVYRIKYQQRFRRAIVLENATYALSEKTEVEALYHALNKVLEVVFDTNIKTNREVLKIFLHLKP